MTKEVILALLAMVAGAIAAGLQTAKGKGHGRPSRKSQDEEQD